MNDFKELREALDAGPTDGPWKADQWTSDEGGCYGWSFSAGGYLLPLSDMETDNPAECDANARYIAAANPATIRSLLAELDAARRDAEAKQARIDALMLEHCPDEMTDEQVASWGDAQVAAKHNPAIDAAMKEQQ